MSEDYKGQTVGTFTDFVLGSQGFKPSLCYSFLSKEPAFLFASKASGRHMNNAEGVLVISFDCIINILFIIVIYLPLGNII